MDVTRKCSNVSPWRKSCAEKLSRSRCHRPEPTIRSARRSACGRHVLLGPGDRDPHIDFRLFSSRGLSALSTVHVNGVGSAASPGDTVSPFHTTGRSATYGATYGFYIDEKTAGRTFITILSKWIFYTQATRSWNNGWFHFTSANSFLDT